MLVLIYAYYAHLMVPQKFERKKTPSLRNTAPILGHKLRVVTYKAGQKNKLQFWASVEAEIAVPKLQKLQFLKQGV